MKKEQKVIKVTVNGEIDLRKMPKELFDLFANALIEEIDKLIKKESHEEAMR